MKISFQKAALPRDRDALVAFDHTTFPRADWFSPDDWGDFESYWMTVDGERVGCCAFERHADFHDNPDRIGVKRRGSLYIVSTGILPKRQRRGFGQRFKRWQIAWARRHGFTRIVTNSRRSNQPMIRLNEKCGFKIVETTSNNYYHGPAEPTVVMELKLARALSRRRRPQSATQEIWMLLIAERNRLSRAIEALTL
jgi:GNAT superfamily N-acetyltransferase